MDKSSPASPFKSLAHKRFSCKAKWERLTSSIDSKHATMTSPQSRRTSWISENYYRLAAVCKVRKTEVIHFTAVQSHWWPVSLSSPKNISSVHQRKAVSGHRALKQKHLAWMQISMNLGRSMHGIFYGVLFAICLIKWNIERMYFLTGHVVRSQKCKPDIKTFLGLHCLIPWVARKSVLEDHGPKAVDLVKKNLPNTQPVKTCSRWGLHQDSPSFGPASMVRLQQSLITTVKITKNDTPSELRFCLSWIKTRTPLSFHALALCIQQTNQRLPFLDGSTSMRNPKSKLSTKIIEPRNSSPERHWRPTSRRPSAKPPEIHKNDKEL